MRGHCMLPLHRYASSQLIVMQIFHSSSSFVVYFSGVPSFPIVYETIIENDVDTYRKGTRLMEEDSRLVTILQQYHTRLYIISLSRRLETLRGTGWTPLQIIILEKRLYARTRRRRGSVFRSERQSFSGQNWYIYIMYNIIHCYVLWKSYRCIYYIHYYARRYDE